VPDWPLGVVPAVLFAVAVLDEVATVVLAGDDDDPHAARVMLARAARGMMVRVMREVIAEPAVCSCG
jgi:hypothetical protein